MFYLLYSSSCTCEASLCLFRSLLLPSQASLSCEKIIQMDATYREYAQIPASGLHMIRLMISTATLTPLPVKSVSMCPSPPGLKARQERYERERRKEGEKDETRYGRERGRKRTARYDRERGRKMIRYGREKGRKEGGNSDTRHEREALNSRSISRVSTHTPRSQQTSVPVR